MHVTLINNLPDPYFLDKAQQQNKLQHLVDTIKHDEVVTLKSEGKKYNLSLFILQKQELKQNYYINKNKHHPSRQTIFRLSKNYYFQLHFSSTSYVFIFRNNYMRMRSNNYHINQEHRDGR